MTPRPRPRAARAAPGRSATARRPARSAPPPSQIRVTNGFHHKRNCQRPCSSPLAEHGVELAVEQRRDRRFAGVGRRRRQKKRACGNRIERSRPSPRRTCSSASSADQFGPTAGCTCRRASPGYGPTRDGSADCDRRPASRSGERAVARHAGQAHRDAEMRDHHAPHVNSGVRRRLRLHNGATLATAEPGGKARARAAARNADASANSANDQRECRAAPRHRHQHALQPARSARRAASAAAAPPRSNATSASATGTSRLVEERRADRQLHPERLRATSG